MSFFSRSKDQFLNFFFQKNDDWPAPFCFPDINNYLNSVFVFHVSTKVKNIYPWVGFYSDQFYQSKQLIFCSPMRISTP